MDKQYITKQAKIAQKTDNELVKKDCYWRILSNSDCPDLSEDGSLTTSQYQQAEQICKESNN
ncbi:MAG: hypothetical protein F6K22_02220 [Okeania sp. SIO2F4]|uniref:hypothetical protein n=1 Tax=Okeania sp. SIO2F4 TaxID=2607790 RepID=UPI00142A1CAB|nr:hypothetical protein [Okeania sp. SIO2F4]NES01739.1 hypothetical protein [Okeania sp. SIO2F4]